MTDQPTPRDQIEAGLVEALRTIAEHVSQYGPNADARCCDESCALEMISTAQSALRRYEGDLQIGRG